MSEPPSITEIKACIKVAAAACGEDGIISSEEEAEMFRLLKERFHEMTEELFEESLAEYFDAELQIEEYLELIVDVQLRPFVLRLAELSASADGLDPRENVALVRAFDFWGIERDA
jgi:hypothetical protein